MFDGAIAHREQGWRVDHLSSSEQLLAPLRGVSTWVTNTNMNAPVHGAGSLVVREELLRRPIDWGRDRLRLWVTVNGEEFPVMTARIDKPSREGSDTGLFRGVLFTDKVSIFYQSRTVGPVSFGTSTPVTEIVESIIRAAGEDSLETVPSSKKLRTPLMFETGTRWLTVINELLGAINYRGVHCDPMGRFVLTPYARPGARPIVWTFKRGSAALHKANWVQEQDYGSVPNRVTLHTVGDDEEPGLISTAVNTDPASPYSFSRRGDVWVDMSAVVEATDQGTLDALAERRLADSSRPVSKLSLEHAFLPLGTGDRCGFELEGFDSSGTLQEATVRGGSDDFMMRSVWREVVRA